MNSLEQAQSIASSLPIGVRSFALDSRYWDPQSHLCPHDGWVHAVAVREIVNKPSPEPISDYERILALQGRRIEITLELLGWSHENLLTFCYDRVVRYSIEMNRLSDRGNRAHGDWLEDTIALGNSGGVVHQIRFSSGAEWLIECSDISFSTTSV